VVKEPNETFGLRIRRLREERGIGLRRFATKIKVSPTYLSKIERGELPPPAEDKVIAIASELDQDPDILLAMADRVASDVCGVILRYPRELPTIIRSAGEFYSKSHVPSKQTDSKHNCLFLSGNDPELLDEVRQLIKGRKKGKKVSGLILVIVFQDEDGGS
jgi:transcriptional regulator with XRE-family HTH domain